ncbi:MAG: hypothetical protein EZS28_027535 [Streblomastix strix]|uniref:Uncharacterized protein n=1 Tax=Streblomastix strix TaxID=222440 RepID=A0A5J4V2J5_9EUKA|nr:MAG: hypothetical protein EZS28_027535 [Streblomastix strix]
MSFPTILEVELQFENKFEVDMVVCRLPLDIISEDEHMVKESVHFALSENYWIRVVDYTFDIPESYVQLGIEDEGCCDRFCNDSTQTLNEIFIGNADKTVIIEVYIKIEVDTLLDNKLNIFDQIYAYIKEEDEALLLLKADKTDIIDAYIKTETDEKFDLKANVIDIVDSYSKIENDELLPLKADKTKLIDAYFKTETDTKLFEKIDKTELDAYVDLTSAQAISDTKQFNTINISSESKQNKNEATILLAGGGDLLMSLLISQPQLQEVRNTATAKSKAYIFDIQTDLNSWIDDQENVAKLAIDMSKVITTLGVATGSGNAITDKSIDGIILTPAKNTTFATNGDDQSNTGTKTFTRSNENVKPLSEFGGGSVDDLNYVKFSCYDEQTIDGELIQLHEEYQPFGGNRQNQYITKRDGTNGFVQLDD